MTQCGQKQVYSGSYEKEMVMILTTDSLTLSRVPTTLRLLLLYPVYNLEGSRSSHLWKQTFRSKQVKKGHRERLYGNLLMERMNEI